MTTYRIRQLISCVFVGMTVLVVSEGVLAQPSTSERPAAGERDLKALATELAADQATVNDLLGANNANLKSPELRAAVGAKLMPPLQRMLDDIGEVAVLVPSAKEQTPANALQLLSILSLVGDTHADARIESMSESAPDRAVVLQASGWLKRWYAAPVTDEAQQAVVDELDQLVRAHTDSDLLTYITLAMSREATSSSQAERLVTLVADNMTTAAATRVKRDRAAKRAAADQDAAEANRPLTLSGTLVDGAAFSTNSLKGKVILIDFWATWCGPCVAELPRVKKAYETWHDKGLEVVGVSNDFDIDALRTYVARASLPWPQLFDTDAASKRAFHPITVAQKIDGIPVLYLIDRKGMLRTVNARMQLEELIPKLLAESE